MKSSFPSRMVRTSKRRVGLTYGPSRKGHARFSSKKLKVRVGSIQDRKEGGQIIAAQMDKLAKKWGANFEVSQRDRQELFNLSANELTLRTVKAILKKDLPGLKRISRELGFTITGIYQHLELMNAPNGVHGEEFRDLIHNVEQKKKQVDGLIRQFNNLWN